MPQKYDAVLIVSFGGPEGPRDVMPFLENVLRGKNVPRERMLEVAEHYGQFGGVSPINQQNRELIAALKRELDERGPQLPIYWGNRNWHPLLADAIRQMQNDGVRRALALVTSAYSSYSSCRQYLNDIQRAQNEAGATRLQVDKLRAFFNHPGFVEPMIERVRAALGEIPADRLATTQLIYTAHSIPESMAAGCEYSTQLMATCESVNQRIGSLSWKLVYQSRSGPPTQPWLGPDICDYLRELNANCQLTDVVVVPIGFVSDHLEVLFDLDTEARQVCEELGVNMVRAATVGTAPRFISMIRELILERTADAARRSVGPLGPSHDVCPENCCPSGRPPIARTR